MKLFQRWATLACAVAMTAGSVAAEGLEDMYRADYLAAFKGKKVAYVPLSMGIDVAESWTAVWKAQADSLGYEFLVRDPNWSASVGAQAVQDLIQEQVDVIIIQNPDLQTYARLAKRAQDAGIYVISIQQSTAIQTEAFVGPDWVTLGEKLVDAVHARCGADSGNSGKIAILQGQPTAAASLFQINGVSAALERYPDLEVVANQAADWDSAKANSVTKVILQQNPDLCGIVGFWDGQDVGAAAAVEEAGMKGKVHIVTSGSGVTAMCDNITSGNFSDVVDMDIRGGARDVNTLIRVLLQSGIEPGVLKSNLYVPLIVVNKENMNAGSCYEPSDLDELGR